MTITQAGSSLTITMSSGRLTDGDLPWSGSMDGASRITAAWQSQGGAPKLSFICDPRDFNGTRNVVLRSATASLNYPSGSATIEGTINSRYDVTSLFGLTFPELSETTTERLTKQ
jgi:hypothetical protein